MIYIRVSQGVFYKVNTQGEVETVVNIPDVNPTPIRTMYEETAKGMKKKFNMELEAGEFDYVPDYPLALANYLASSIKGRVVLDTDKNKREEAKPNVIY